MAKTKTLELSLEQARIDTMGGPRKGKHMVIVSLVWPRPRIAERVAVKTLDFRNNAVDLSKSGWTEKILFKELILGQLGIEVGVTERVSDSQAADFFRFLGSSLLKMAGSEADDLMIDPLAGGIVKLPFQYLSNVIAKPAKKGPKMIASGMIDIDPDKTWKNKKTARIQVPLTATQSIYRIAKGSKGSRGKRQLVLEAGAPNGLAVLSGKLY